MPGQTGELLAVTAVLVLLPGVEVDSPLHEVFTGENTLQPHQDCSVELPHWSLLVEGGA